MTFGLEQLLRDCTVSIEARSDLTTGFFVAPGYIVGLLSGESALERRHFTVRWEPNEHGGGGQAVAAVTRHELVDPDLLPTSETYRLCHLTVDGFQGHPCVSLDLADPSSMDELVAVGLPGRGEPTTLEAFESCDTQPYERVLHDQELSRLQAHGAPVLNTRTQGVCGIVVPEASRSGQTAVILWSRWSADSPSPSFFAANQAFHDKDIRWAQSADPNSYLPPIVHAGHAWRDKSVVDISNREEFRERLTELSWEAQLSARVEAQGTTSPTSTADYLAERHLPKDIRTLDLLLARCGVHTTWRIGQWHRAYREVRSLERRAARQRDASGQQRPGLLFRVYIPLKRLYAAEADNLLALFRDWLIAQHGQGFRQDGYRTASGTVYEFYAEGSLAQLDMQQQFATFSNFLNLCADNPSEAVRVLNHSGLERDASAQLVARTGREVRDLRIGLREEYEKRSVALRYALLRELNARDADLSGAATVQVDALIQQLVPRPDPRHSLALLAESWTAQPGTSMSVTINQQNINALEAIVIDTVQGNVQLAPQAKQLLALIKEHGGDQAAALESAVYEVADNDARPMDRSAAKRRLLKFLKGLGSFGRDISEDLLVKWLESKGL